MKTSTTPNCKRMLKPKKNLDRVISVLRLPLYMLESALMKKKQKKTHFQGKQHIILKYKGGNKKIFYLFMPLFILIIDSYK